MKGYASRLSQVDQAHSSYVPVSGEALLIADDMHGGGGGGFTVPLTIFSDPDAYKGMSGSVLTYLGEPLAVQEQAWPGPPAKLEFRRLDLLVESASEILERHGIETLSLPSEEPRLFIVQDSEPFEPGAAPDPLPVPIVKVDIDVIDSVRTHDFAASPDGSIGFRLKPLDLDGLASGQLKHVLIEAPAGFGKTFLLRRTAADLSQGRNTFFVTCNRIPGSVLQGVPATELLHQVIAEAISPSAAERFAECGLDRVPRLLVLDGLNEVAVDPSAIERLLHQARVCEDLAVLASQRPAVTRAPPDGYTLGFLLPLDDQFVVGSLGAVDPDSMRLLRIPLFFDLKRAKNIEGTTQVEAVHAYFVRCLLGLDQFRDLMRLTRQARAQRLAPAFHSVGTAAREIYRERQSTAAERQFFFDKGLFAEIGGLDQALVAGFAVSDGDLIRFRHQLFHDFAVAKFYLDESILLKSIQPRAELDVATLSRQSTDSLELLVQMYAQRSPDDAETVVRKIYDWDYPGAVASLISWINVAEPTGPLRQPPRHLKVSTFSLIAEKKFDLFEHTVRRFDSIRSSMEPVLRSQLPLLPARYGLMDLIEAARQADLGSGVPKWYRSWRRAFCQDMSFYELLMLLQSDDGTLGWTASNVLARSRVTNDQGSEIIELFAAVGGGKSESLDQAATVRWRLVHAVGRSPWAVEFLGATARDASVEHDVRYGAVRSLFSIALTNNYDAAHSSIDAVSSLDAAGLLRHPRVASAIMRCSIPAPGIEPPSPDYWVASFEAMLARHRTELENSDHPHKAEEWKQRLEELKAWKRSVDD
jgi:hypothetical protein